MTEMDLGPVRGPEQPDNTPTAKVTAGTLAGAFTAVIISITEYFGVNLPPDFAAAVVVLLGFGAAYMKRSRPGEVDF